VNGVEVGYAAAWRVVRALPAPVARGLFTAAADLTVRRNPKGVDRLRENLRRVAGPENLDALVRAAMRSYLRYYLEAFRLPGYSREDILRMFHLDGEQQLRADVESGRGAVVALPHGGNWDLAGAWVAVKGWPLVVIAERLRPEGLYRRFLEFREGLGMEVIPLTGAEKPPIDLLVERLEKGYVVALLADRDLPGRGVEVDFFGGRTTMPPGPALLALRSGAPLYAVDMWYEPDTAWARLNGPLPLPAPESGPLTERIRVVTQDIADRLAAGIARHPEDWHMLQRMWREPARTREPGRGRHDRVHRAERGPRGHA
jgi:lauroyl/myristoyl acyltransferase